MNYSENAKEEKIELQRILAAHILQSLVTDDESKINPFKLKYEKINFPNRILLKKISINGFQRFYLEGEPDFFIDESNLGFFIRFMIDDGHQINIL